MEKVELYHEVNGVKLTCIILTEIPNFSGDLGNDFGEYKIEYIDFIDNKIIVVGTTDLIMGCINFEKTSGVGIAHEALLLLCKWIETNLKK